MDMDYMDVESQKKKEQERQSGRPAHKRRRCAAILKRMFKGVWGCSPDKQVGISASAGISAVQVCPDTCPACKRTS